MIDFIFLGSKITADGDCSHEIKRCLLLGRKNSNLRDADDTTLMAEGEEELKSLLMKVKEESKKSWLETQHLKSKIMVSGPITSWQIDGGKVEQ